MPHTNPSEFTASPICEAVRAALDCIPPDVGHVDRVRIAFAVFDGLGDAGADLWKQWAARRAMPSPEEDSALWSGARKSGPVKVATLFAMAAEHGYRPELVQAPATKPTAAELQAQSERLIRLPETLQSVCLGRTAWLDLVKAKQAPQPVKIGRATFWVYSEVQAFIAERIRQAREVRKC